MNEQTKHLATIAQAAQDVFWAAIVKQFPNAKSGDFPPDATFAFNEACTEAVRVWAEYNVPEKDTTGER